jgi:hypothetical protein
MMNPEPLTTRSRASRFCPDCGHARGPADGDLCGHCGGTLVIGGYCPICESRLRLRVGELCPKHDVKLLSDDEGMRPRLSADASIAWVTVRRFPDSLAVAAARIRLEAEGIPTFVEGERMGAPSMYRVATGGVKLQVPAQLAADARIILDQDWSWPDDELDPDDGDGDDLNPGLEERAHFPDSSRAFFIEVGVILALAIPMLAWLIVHLRGG